jgi:hypothetical protein
VVAAITLCVPSGRMSAARKREMLPDLLQAAREIAHTSLQSQSSKLATMDASVVRARGRRRPDPNRKVAQ